MLDSGLTDILTLERIETSFDKQRFGEVILSTMPRQLTTPRAVERFLAQAREQFRAHDLEEMNDVDLILATFLRVQFPDVFARLQFWKADLTKVTPSYARLNRHEEQQPDWETIVNVLRRRTIAGTQCRCSVRYSRPYARRTPLAFLRDGSHTLTTSIAIWLKPSRRATSPTLSSAGYWGRRRPAMPSTCVPY